MVTETRIKYFSVSCHSHLTVTIELSLHLTDSVPLSKKKIAFLKPAWWQVLDVFKSSQNICLDTPT